MTLPNEHCASTGTNTESSSTLPPPPRPRALIPGCPYAPGHSPPRAPPPAAAGMTPPASAPARSAAAAAGMTPPASAPARSAAGPSTTASPATRLIRLRSRTMRPRPAPYHPHSQAAERATQRSCPAKMAAPIARRPGNTMPQPEWLSQSEQMPNQQPPCLPCLPSLSATLPEESFITAQSASRQAQPAGPREGTMTRDAPVWARPGPGSGPTPPTTPTETSSPVTSKVSPPTRPPRPRAPKPTKDTTHSPKPSTPTAQLKLALLNTWSLPNHATEIHDYLVDSDTDILAVTETWLHPASGPAISLALPPDFSILRHDRSSGRGGGVALIFRNTILPRVIDCQPIPGCECLLIKFQPCPNSTINILLLYRPPNNMPEFEAQLLELITPLLKPNTKFLLLGDVNFGLHDPADKPAQSLARALSDLGFCLPITEPTHRHGRTLDWIATHNIDLSDPAVHPCPWSDHYILRATLPLASNSPTLPPPHSHHSQKQAQTHPGNPGPHTKTPGSKRP